MRNERRHGNQREPARVSGESGTTQAGEVRARWAWVEPCVWTDRMLTTLETRVKGGMWSSDGPTRILPNAGCSPVTQSVGKKSVRGNGEPSTGEPYAGNPPVRFGGRGDVIPVVPTPIPIASPRWNRKCAKRGRATASPPRRRRWRRLMEGPFLAGPAYPPRRRRGRRLRLMEGPSLAGPPCGAANCCRAAIVLDEAGFYWCQQLPRMAIIGINY
jgi:hypothetical protein